MEGSTFFFKSYRIEKIDQSIPSIPYLIIKFLSGTLNSFPSIPFSKFKTIDMFTT